jgi:alkylation response protein AidB-like acyl-CoA dehydrogenase
MDLNYGPEYERFRGEVREFLQKHGDEGRGLAFRSPKSLAWQKLMIERGYTARTIPREYGGHGGEPDILKSRIIAEEFAAAQVSPGMGGQGISMLVPTLLEMGSEEQKRRFIPPTLSGEMIWCQGYSEPGAGSDLASLTTRAELDGDEWSSTARRSGPARPISPTGSSAWCARNPRRRNTRASAFCCFRWPHPASRYGR